MASFSFDINSVEKRENNFELLPAGKYLMQIVETSIAPLKSGNGTALKATAEVLADGYRGRKIFMNLNIQHTNAQTEQIAQQQLRELCEAIGLARMTDTGELHNKPFEGNVKIRKSQDPQYQDQNEVNGFKSAAGASVPAFRPGAPSAASAPAAAAGAKTPPWAAKQAVAA